MHPDRADLPPSYQQQSFTDTQLRGHWLTVAAPDARDGTVQVCARLRVLAARLGPQETVHYTLPPGRMAWLHLARGAGALETTTLEAGDGAGLTTAGEWRLTGADGGAETLLLELPA